MQISQNVFNFLAVVEFQPADYDIRNFLAHEAFLEHSRLGVRAIQKRDVVIVKVFVFDEPLNLPRHRQRLQQIAFATHEFNFIADFVLRPKIFGLAVDIVLNNRVRCV